MVPDAARGEVTLCPHTWVMLKGGDREHVEGNQLYVAPCYALSTHLSLLAACRGSLLMPTLQVRTLWLREVNALARSHTAEKLTVPQGHLLPQLPGKGEWAWEEARDPRVAARKPCSPGQPGPLAAAVYEAQGWPEMFCFTNARRLIWGKFAPL